MTSFKLLLYRQFIKAIDFVASTNGILLASLTGTYNIVPTCSIALYSSLSISYSLRKLNNEYLLIGVVKNVAEFDFSMLKSAINIILPSYLIIESIFKSL